MKEKFYSMTNSQLMEMKEYYYGQMAIIEFRDVDGRGTQRMNDYIEFINSILNERRKNAD